MCSEMEQYVNAGLRMFIMVDIFCNCYAIMDWICERLWHWVHGHPL